MNEVVIYRAIHVTPGNFIGRTGSSLYFFLARAPIVYISSSLVSTSLFLHRTKTFAKLTHTTLFEDLRLPCQSRQARLTGAVLQHNSLAAFTIFLHKSPLSQIPAEFSNPGTTPTSKSFSSYTHCKQSHLKSVRSELTNFESPVNFQKQISIRHDDRLDGHRKSKNTPSQSSRATPPPQTSPHIPSIISHSPTRTSLCT